ncbi:MAG: hypothetical protein ACUZ8O_11865 [Candidatus Anammoxibacter sp.]
MNLPYKKMQKFIKYSNVYVLILALSIILHSNAFGHECGRESFSLRPGTVETYIINGDHIANFRVTNPFIDDVSGVSLVSISPTTITASEDGVFLVRTLDTEPASGVTATFTIMWTHIETEEPPNPDSGECSFTVALPGSRKCGVKLLTEDDPQRRKKREIFYDFRDKVLGQTSTGRHLNDFYYKHTNEVNEILIQYPDIFTRAKKMQKRFFPKILALSVGLDIKLTKGDIDDVIELLSVVKDYGSVELEYDLLTFINDIEEEGILEQFGIEIDE